MPYILRKPGKLVRSDDMCGEFCEIFGPPVSKNISISRFRVAGAKKHIHKKTTEIYHVLSGSGYIEIDNKRERLKEGYSVMIKPNTPHRAIADAGSLLELLVICSPAWAAEDQFESKE
jgi:mannose-6-phosphate isomerase-like protein (cupin superfamily)